MFSKTWPCLLAYLSAIRVRLFFSKDEEPGIAKLLGQAQTVLWDERRFRLPSTALLALRTLWLADSIEIQVAAPRAPWRPAPLFHLHPERFKQSRPHAKKRVALWRRTNQDNRSLEHVLHEAAALMQEAYDAALPEFPLRPRLDLPNPGLLLVSAEESLAHFFTEYGVHGNQIFDIPPTLTEMLRNTSADDVPIPMLASPYHAYFIHFGPQPDMDLGNGWLVDGCYVEHQPAAKFIQFCFTALPPCPDDIRNWPVSPEPHGVHAFGGELFAYDVGAALDHFMSNVKHRIHQEKAGSSDVERSLDDFKRANPHDPVAMLVKSGTRDRARQEEEILDKRHSVLHRALSLVINTVCYLTAFPDDIETKYPETAPQKLVQQLQSNSPKAVARAKSKLEALGFTPVHLAGRGLKTASSRLESDAERGSTGHTVRKHWRRGHWRRTPFGPGREQRRLNWIMPTLVQRNQPGDPDPEGHLYLVD